jgi:hypothetical protein
MAKRLSTKAAAVSTNLVNPVNPLLNVSTAMLEDELARRKEEADEQKRVAAQQRFEALQKALPLLLVLRPDHYRTSCSDENHCNSDRGCVRCGLLELQRAPNEFSPQTDIGLEIYLVRW